MRALIVGCGLVGGALADSLTADGHQVVGTTTTPGRVEELSSRCTEVRVLRGSDAAAVADAAAGCDAVVVAAGPAAARAMTAEERAATYQEVLVDTATSVVAAVQAAGVTGPVVSLSSLSVYGRAADGLDRIDEDAPLTASADASPRFFQAMERTYLDGLPDQACVLRCADVYGEGDMPVEDKIRMAHTVLKGSVPFRGDALFYRVHVDDVVAATRHAVEAGLAGVFNLTHGDVPPTSRVYFDAVGAGLGFGPLTFRDEIETPGRPISIDRLLATGFTLSATTPAAAG